MEDLTEKSEDRIFETQMYWPDKMSVEEFIEALTDPIRTKNFIENMNYLISTGRCNYLKAEFPEDWIQTYARWSEMKQMKVENHE